MLNRHVFKLTATLIAVLAVGLGWSSADAAVSKTSAVITLKHVFPEAVMRELGLLNPGARAADRIQVWFADGSGKQDQTAAAKQAPPSALPLVPVDKPQRIEPNIPTGIDMVVPYNTGSVLVVYGEKTAIDKLKASVKLLDVPQKKIGIKAEAYLLDLEFADELGLGVNQTGQTAISNKDAIDEIRARLHEPQAVLVSSPVISLYQNIHAEIMLSSDSKLWVLPKINADGTITLYVEWSIDQVEESIDNQQVPPADQQFPRRSFQTIRTNRRFTSGDSIILGGFARDPGKSLVMILSAQILDK